MKKGSLLLLFIVLVSGLVTLGAYGGAALGLFEKEKHVMNTHDKKEHLLSQKEWIEPELVLIDSRDGTEIQKVKASSLKSKEYTENLAAELEAKYDKPMIPAKLGTDGKLKEGQARVVLDKEAFIQELTNVKALQKVIEVPITETAPNITAEAIANIDQVLLGSYTTKFNPNIIGRSRNIELSAQEINQIILGPGDRFYFNLVVGERTPERGYQKAMEIVNHEFVEGIGGGICQTSSTLYNAIDKAGLGILELHHHSKAVGYVPQNRDATVSWGGKDLKFMNNKEYPVMIKTIVNKQNGTIEVQVRAAAQYVAKN
jgi:vancomycin resistance protein YoaR